ncbi:carboxypeptidase-like regulatory domain-containing protein [Sinosporangium siamense]|uniref:Carboxypeptidase regulatory-like domain-containing protein n=1 Tax=Sinosporangium siamense TaxID=1367973 RepID=A0A919RDX9_9ACTN|nr:carboxypeptidase-like regulatory domain-containing protein [Sinosporangium siamense]GII92136.1 hypothetical protein Ssi02_23670 [Sinosporangium siamense]
MIDNNAGVCTATLGTAPNRSFVLEWRNATFEWDTGKRISFSVVLGEDGSIGFHYKGDGSDRSSGSRATIGLEQDDWNAFEYSFNETALAQSQSLTFTATRHPPPATRHGVLAGVVTDANDGKPLAGATVKVGDGTTAKTNEDGIYAAQVPPGDHRVTVHKENYGTLTQAATVAAGERTFADLSLITSRVSASVREVDLVMSPDSRKDGTFLLTNLGGSATTSRGAGPRSGPGGGHTHRRHQELHGAGDGRAAQRAVHGA